MAEASRVQFTASGRSNCFLVYKVSDSNEADIVEEYRSVFGENAQSEVADTSSAQESSSRANSLFLALTSGVESNNTHTDHTSNSDDEEEGDRLMENLDDTYDEDVEELRQYYSKVLVCAHLIAAERKYSPYTYRRDPLEKLKKTYYGESPNKEELLKTTPTKTKIQKSNCTTFPSSFEGQKEEVDSATFSCVTIQYARQY
ncbi:hypothetical protein GN244_ATG15379 [Phytophthora infestans]|uniref:Uncharacterized protein n=1 Tax=Phytophthora infestans TaxID=4787 RepID=A0A833W7M7_PHYIN|nr:hypothetical protein GN244_ATG15379 [Phytophthora infestans]KAF4142840.1 hypothetical protein GN958_ATG07977 [Phytophthora infestans]